jgi:hypothetical protein
VFIFSPKNYFGKHLANCSPKGKLDKIYRRYILFNSQPVLRHSLLGDNGIGNEFSGQGAVNPSSFLTISFSLTKVVLPVG